jgi:hypothetical protein
MGKHNCHTPYNKSQRVILVMEVYMPRSDHFVSSALQEVARHGVRRQDKSLVYVWLIPTVSSPLNRIYAILLVKINEYHVILTNIFPLLRVISSGPTSTGASPVSRTYDDTNCFLSISLDNFTKDSKLHDIFICLQPELR